MREYDDGRIGAIAGEVPYGQLRSVKRAHDRVLGLTHAFAPPQRHVASVSLTSARTTRGEPPGDHTGNAGCRQDAPDEQQAGPAPVATRRR